MANLIRVATLSLAVGWIVFGGAATAALVITGYSDATNDRFSNDSSFIASGFDLSGIGQAGTGRWATAISRNVVLTAAHFRPTGQVFFQPGNDPSVAPVVRTIVTGSRVGSSDLYVSVLNKPLPSSIAHYSFATEMLTGTPPDGQNAFLEAAGIYQDLNAYMFGLSPLDHSLDPNRSAYTDQAVGRNLISGYSENFPFQTNTDNDSLILFFDGLGTANNVNFESRVAVGDSGAPLFVDMGGEFRLLGINSFALNDNSGSGVTYVGNKTSIISDYIVAYAVPEPGTITVLAVCSIAIIARRRRMHKITSRTGARVSSKVIAILLVILACSPFVDAAADETFFESKVRPLLVERCYECHSGTKSMGGLSLDTKVGWQKGGDSGTAIVPGKPDGSLLIAAINYEPLEMPPPDKGGKLSSDQIAVLRKWVSTGAHDPRVDEVKLGGMKIQDAKTWWAFQPLPTAEQSPSPKNIDAFIDQSLSSNATQPGLKADKRTLIRRATFDLTGLPPTAVEVDAFLADQSDDAFAKLVERLLASPEYGVQWGRHWLDVVRYADTAGENTDRPLPHAWRYRNWVFDAFNRDMPYGITHFVPPITHFAITHFVPPILFSLLPKITHLGITHLGITHLGITHLGITHLGITHLVPPG